MNWPVLLAAAEISEQTVANWVVQLIQLGIVGVLSFFMKRTLDQIETAISALTTKVDALKEKRGEDHTAARLLEQRVENLERDFAEFKRDLSEGSIVR